LAENLLAAGSLGIVYPSVREPGGTCLACFRPALVMNVAKGASYRLRWNGETTPSVSVASVDEAAERRPKGKRKQNLK
jgi:hypothetical protein